MTRVEFAQVAVMTKDARYMVWFNWFWKHWRCYLSDVSRRNLTLEEFCLTLQNIVTSTFRRSGAKHPEANTVKQRENENIFDVYDAESRLIITVYYKLKFL